MFLAEKTFNELKEIEKEIFIQKDKDKTLDLKYWHTILELLKVQKAIVWLKDLHNGAYKKYLETSIKHDAKEIIPNWKILSPVYTNLTHKVESNNIFTTINNSLDKHSPEPESMDKIEPSKIKDPEHDLCELKFLRFLEVYHTTKMFEHNKINSNYIRSSEENFDLHQNFMKISSKIPIIPNFNQSFQDFKKTNIQLQSKVFWWHEKYKPRKPKYFNRVHTGYEWNKYNQTHYDSENPPPKVVIGYKFNIFYPNLINESSTPHYKLEKDPESKDGSSCIIRFHAGPPYEDIAFKIVNKDWETLTKKGYRCIFERGVLHLYFNFVRLRYRR